MVDTVLYFEGEKNGDLRILRANKNRFGPTDEVGIFKMDEKGLSDVSQSDLNLVSGEGNKVGSAVTILMEGTRPVMVEIQALIVESFAPMPRRVFAGVDFNRGQLLTAIGQKSLGMPLYKYDVFISVTGGIKVDDTGADLAILAAMWSSYKEKPLLGGVFVGEVSLLGEVRKVKFWEKRKKEAEAMGKKMVEIKNVREIK
jgi:DNA repair protein RadA/Sms